MLSLIAAVARNRAIGKDNRLLWHLPEDMRHFREITHGKPLIMGRKTWESLPEKFRPLPGRLNIIVSRNQQYQASGAVVSTSLADALQQATRLAPEAAEIFVIGGAELYRQALPLAKRLYLTEIDVDFAGDAFFPEVDQTQWQEVRRQAHVHALETGSGQTFNLAFVEYQRQPGTIPPALRTEEAD